MGYHLYCCPPPHHHHASVCHVTHHLLHTKPNPKKPKKKNPPKLLPNLTKKQPKTPHDSFEKGTHPSYTPTRGKLEREERRRGGKKSQERRRKKNRSSKPSSSAIRRLPSSPTISGGGGGDGPEEEDGRGAAAGRGRPDALLHLLRRRQLPLPALHPGHGPAEALLPGRRAPRHGTALPDPPVFPSSCDGLWVFGGSV